MTYAEFGQQHTHENRVMAAEAAIAILFCTDWSDRNRVSYMSPAVERLEAFAGEEAWLEAAERVNILSMGDGVNRAALEAGIKALKSAFDHEASPNSHRWWREVARHARAAAREAEEAESAL